MNPKKILVHNETENPTELLGQSCNHIYNKNGPPDPLDPKIHISVPGFTGCPMGNRFKGFVAKVALKNRIPTHQTTVCDKVKQQSQVF